MNEVALSAISVLVPLVILGVMGGFVVLYRSKRQGGFDPKRLRFWSGAIVVPIAIAGVLSVASAQRVISGIARPFDVIVLLAASALCVLGIIVKVFLWRAIVRRYRQ